MEISQKRIDELVKAAKKARRGLKPFPRWKGDTDQSYNKAASHALGKGYTRICSGCGRTIVRSHAFIEGDVLCKRCQEAMDILDGEGDT